MIHLFVNALAASAGGGLTYVRNIVPHLSARADARFTLLVGKEFQSELNPGDNIELVCESSHLGVAARFLYEQRTLANLVRSRGADVLLSAGNFALRNSPVPQILLSRNALYTCPDFYRDLRGRREYRLWLDTCLKAWLAKRSVMTADIAVAPSKSFAEELRRWTGKDIVAIHHGFDADTFSAEKPPLDHSIQDKLAPAQNGIRLLFVSHYNYYRNFETLIHAMGRVIGKPGGEQFKLVLTCALRSGANPGSYRSEAASQLVAHLGLQENIIELGSVPYSQLHHLYRGCDIYVSPSYCESFAHPLVEAMSCGLPIVASDLPVHREICEKAALYFPPFDAEKLCDQIMHMAASDDLRNDLATLGRVRARQFSWSGHVDRILALASQLIAESR